MCFTISPAEINHCYRTVETSYNTIRKEKKSLYDQIIEIQLRICLKKLNPYGVVPQVIHKQLLISFHLICKAILTCDLQSKFNIIWTMS